MKKHLWNDRSLIVILDDGTMLQNDSCDKELYEKVLQCSNDAEIALLLMPNLQKVLDEQAKVRDFYSAVSASSLLTSEGSSIYWRGVSELSLPQNFVEKILEAEKENNQDALEAYKNFWTLLSLNPDERVRQNLFWFLGNWGMRISKTGADQNAQSFVVIST